MSKIDRRNFLKGCLATTAATISTGILTSTVFAQADPLRPFEILVLGDSIMWGQGLLDKDKFSFKVADWFRTDVFRGARRVSDPHVEAHSGATIFPEFDTEKEFSRQNFFGESNLSNPSILYQIENALEYYNRPEGTASKPVSPENVDLILIDGGINDFNAASLLSPKIDDTEISAYARDFCGHGMRTVLRLLCTSFPNAKIVVTGYYAPFSNLTDPHIISKTMFRAVGLRPPMINIPFINESTVVKRLAERSALWRAQSDSQLRNTVSILNTAFPSRKRAAGGANDVRILFVPAPFGPEHAYGTGAERTYLWTLGKDLLPGDDRRNQRMEGCLKDVTGLHLKTCNRAAAFHPNVKGANAYFEAIRDALKSYFL